MDPAIFKAGGRVCAVAWVKLDDGFYDNPKILRAGLTAAGLYTAGLTYAARKLTDGFLADVAVNMLVGDSGTGLPGRLIEAGLWSAVEGGYQIHDYLEYNPPASQVKAERQAAKNRMQKLRSGNVRANISEVRDSVPVPVPVPVPEEKKILAIARTRASRAQRATTWPDDFTLLQERIDEAMRVGADPAWEWGKFRDYHQAKGSRFVAWPAAWRTWLRNAVDFEQRRRRG
jgi:hypothetical protein